MKRRRKIDQSEADLRPRLVQYLTDGRLPTGKTETDFEVLLFAADPRAMATLWAEVHREVLRRHPDAWAARQGWTR